MTLINWNLIKSPLNWFTILLMVLIAGIAIHLVMEHHNVNPAIPSQTGQ